MIKELSLVFATFICLARTNGYEIGDGNYVIAPISPRQKPPLISQPKSLSSQKYFEVSENNYHYFDAEEECERRYGKGWGLACITTPEEWTELDTYMSSKKLWGSYVLGGAFVHTPGQPVYVGEWQWIRLNGTENLKFKPFVEKLFRPSSEKNWYFSRAAYISGTLKVEDMHDRNYFICEDLNGKLPKH